MGAIESVADMFSPPTLPQVAYLAREREKGHLIRIMSPYSKYSFNLRSRNLAA
jgi:hypothetical protein